ncbi:MAG TPA: tryptophan 7-halogenase [Planctomycetota bacterium]|nr:tryptophan 7-halogenase [Planctomycetota bacterium]
MNDPTIPRPVHDSDDEVWDVVIAGAGLAGLLLGRQIRRQLPQLSVAMVERTARPLPDACHKVGESSVELASQYLESLGLGEYLLDRQLIKWGLRFFPGGGDLPLHERTEIGPCAEPLVKSYQLDRGRFESDLRGFFEQDGGTLIEGAKVTDIELGARGAHHRVRYEKGGTTRSLTARWVVDASGRQAIVRKKQKLTRGSGHAASAGWFRVAGKFDINEMVDPIHAEWHNRPCRDKRWQSTNHFMGAGYWAWVIPLSTGNTSIGLVIHEDTHDYHHIAGLDNTLAFLRQHEPHLAKALEKYEILDFLCLRNYAHSVGRCWSHDRWAIVGEAGAFVDPLFSPGSDLIAFANTFTVELLRSDQRGDGDLEQRALALNAQYRSVLAGTFQLFRSAAPIYGHPSAMAYKVFWDNFAYWSFTCQYFQQALCRLTGDAHERFSEIGQRFLGLTDRVEDLLRRWALLAPEPQLPVFKPAPAFPSVLVDAHIAVGQKMSVDETLAYMKHRLAQGHELIAEIVLRIVQELGPEHGQMLLDEVRFSSWGVPIAPARLEIEQLTGLERRHGLPDLARDAERSLGPVRRHARAAEARELLAQYATP